MPAKPDNSTAQGFLGSVAKYSISTVVNVFISGLALVLTSLFIPEAVNGEVSLFTQWSYTIFTFAILGLDQSLIRFYYDAPAGLSRNGLFRLCFYFSSAVLLGAGVVCSTLLQRPIYAAIGFETVGPGIVPLLFLNALFYMLIRYYGVMYRMEMNIPLYTVVTIAQQFFFRMFYLFGYFAAPQNPVPVMMGASLVGLGGFAVVFSLFRRRLLRPRLAEFRGGAYKTLLPFGIATAPTALLLAFNSSLSLSFITDRLDAAQNGTYAYAVQLANMVSAIQLGFSAFWSAYMYENYKTQQKRIMQVHDYLNFVVLVFFCCLVAFQDILFLILPGYPGARGILPLMMLAAVFTILCETTVYGNAIAKRPIFDTLGWGVSLAVNLGLLNLLVGPLGLVGAAAALAAANLAMYLLRTLTAQKFYKSVPRLGKTLFALAVAAAVAVAGTLLSDAFVAKGLVCLAAIGLYCLVYRGQLKGLWNLCVGLLKSLFARKK